MQNGLTRWRKSLYNPRFNGIQQGWSHGQSHFRKKRIRRNARRAAINGARMSRIRTFIKKVETAIASGDNDAAREALRVAQPEIQRGVSRGVLHRNTASRKISRLAARVKAIAA